MIDLRYGAWQTVLEGVEVDALICDPPYSARVHEVVQTRSDGGRRRAAGGAASLNDAPSFAAWDGADVAAFVVDWSPRVRGWMACLTSHDLVEAYRDAYELAGRYSFAPVPCVISGMTVRLAGDGPASWAVYAMVARPRDQSFIGGWANPGAYVVSSGGARAGAGRGKPAALEHALVRDYSRPGDLVCDPVAGWGGFLRAAVHQGRRAIGAEIDRGAHRKAMVLSRYLARTAARKERRA